MKWSENAIAAALAEQTFNRKYLVVVPNCSWPGSECDLLAVTENLRIIDVEIKISRSDLKADEKKDKWVKRTFAGYEPEERVHDSTGRLIRVNQRAIYDERRLEWPHKVWKHYYALPEEIWTDELMGTLGSPASGVLLLAARENGQLKIRCKRPAKPSRDANKLTPEAVVNIARLASLRMWNAYRELDRERRRVAA